MFLTSWSAAAPLRERLAPFLSSRDTRIRPFVNYLLVWLPSGRLLFVAFEHRVESAYAVSIFRLARDSGRR
jgi:hypothetical protein